MYWLLLKIKFFILNLKTGELRFMKFVLKFNILNQSTWIFSYPYRGSTKHDLLQKSVNTISQTQVIAELCVLSKRISLRFGCTPSEKCLQIKILVAMPFLCSVFLCPGFSARARVFMCRVLCPVYLIAGSYFSYFWAHVLISNSKHD